LSRRRPGSAASARLVLFALPNLLAIDRDLFGGFDPDTNLIAFESKHSDADARAEPDRLLGAAGEYEHSDSFHDGNFIVAVFSHDVSVIDIVSSKRRLCTDTTIVQEQGSEST
jgi:hypothetical protein